MWKLFTLLIFIFLYSKPVIAEGTWQQVSTNPFLSTVETTPWSIIIGEYDTRLWLYPFNGIYSSNDLGVTWSKQGLDGRGITGLKYYKDKIYASTYYWKNNQVGLFASSDKGSSWQHLGNNFSTSSIDRDDQTIYLGGYSHGLWISQDEGVSWVQKLGDGWTGPKIISIKSADNISFVATVSTVYLSKDHGETWRELPILSNKSIKYFSIAPSTILAGSSGNTGGLYISHDEGETWLRSNNFGDYAVGSISFYNNTFYSGRLNPSLNKYSIYSSKDFGNTWVNTNLDIPYTYSTTMSTSRVFSVPSYLYTIQSSLGMYRYTLPADNIDTFQFLRMPWEYKDESELISKIYSFFDHAYPFLGYNFYTEPQQENDSTLNFYGKYGWEPAMYYSSHNGYDFALPYGANILSAAPGKAVYYYCGVCGNTIKIDHQNGYQTTYMHLQDNGLINNTSIPVWVDEGIVVGKVGMTGNTTGPHLHFEVLKDVNGNFYFDDDIPTGRVDPFSWQNSFYSDPWEKYEWSDSIGTHRGISSPYMWKNTLPGTNKYVNNNKVILQVRNATLQVDEYSFDQGITIDMKPYSIPVMDSNQNNIVYVPDTSVSIEALNHFGELVGTLINPALLSYSLVNLNFEYISPSDLQVYSWDQDNKQWIPIPSIFNEINNTIETYINHFSYYALFTNKQDTPHINVNGKVKITNTNFIIQ